MDLSFKIVRRLLRDDEVKFSRNRHFEAYEDPHVKRALRIYRHLRSVERDLLAMCHDGAVQLDAVEQHEDQVTIRLTFPEKRGYRMSYLSRREWLLLLESEKVSTVLQSLIESASPDTQLVLQSSLSLKAG